MVSYTNNLVKSLGKLVCFLHSLKESLGKLVVSNTNTLLESLGNWFVSYKNSLEQSLGKLVVSYTSSLEQSLGKLVVSYTNNLLESLGKQVVAYTNSLEELLGKLWFNKAGRSVTVRDTARGSTVEFVSVNESLAQSGTVSSWKVYQPQEWTPSRMTKIPITFSTKPAPT